MCELVRANYMDVANAANRTVISNSEVALGAPGGALRQGTRVATIVVWETGMLRIFVVCDRIVSLRAAGVPVRRHWRGADGTARLARHVHRRLVRSPATGHAAIAAGLPRPARRVGTAPPPAESAFASGIMNEPGREGCRIRPRRARRGASQQSKASCPP